MPPEPSRDSSLRRLLLVDEDASLRRALPLAFTREGRDLVSVGDARAALTELDARGFDAVIVDLRLARRAAFELLDALAARSPAPLVLVTTSPSTTAADELLDAVRRGAHDGLQKPYRPDELLLALRKAEERERARQGPATGAGGRGVASGSQAGGAATRSGLIGTTPVMASLLRTIAKVAEFKTNVLITGESGTGKELVARALHDQSPRAGKPFVAVNCGAIPGTLLETELFGHKKGSFTDASADKTGLFEEADGGTLFLDEIGEMPQALQVKLLRALQQETIRRVGDNTETPVDVRVVAATMRDLPEDVKAGRFREDLFYRLNVISIRLPSLRERPGDIPMLVEHFMARYALKHARAGVKVTSVSPEALALLRAHDWPGNVRELENAIERAMVLAEGKQIEASLLEERLKTTPDPLRHALLGHELSIKKTTRLIEEELIRKALASTNGNRTSAAKILEISHRALLYKIKEYRIS